MPIRINSIDDIEGHLSCSVCGLEEYRKISSALPVEGTWMMAKCPKCKSIARLERYERDGSVVLESESV